MILTSNKAGTVSVVMTTVIILLLITPFCGWLFACGCTWPLNGLADHCNYYNHSTGPKCPWCESGVMAAFILGSSSCVAAYLSFRLSEKNCIRVNHVSLIASVLVAVVVFLTLASLLSLPLAQSQAYY